MSKIMQDCKKRKQRKRQGYLEIKINLIFIYHDPQAKQLILFLLKPHHNSQTYLKVLIFCFKHVTFFFFVSINFISSLLNIDYYLFNPKSFQPTQPEHILKRISSHRFQTLHFKLTACRVGFYRGGENMWATIQDVNKIKIFVQ